MARRKPEAQQLPLSPSESSSDPIAEAVHTAAEAVVLPPKYNAQQIRLLNEFATAFMTGTPYDMHTDVVRNRAKQAFERAAILLEASEAFING
jgi:hypothetical protein